MYLTIAHKGMVYNTLFELKAEDQCGVVYRTVSTKLRLNPKRIILLNERGILRSDQTVESCGLLEDDMNTVYVVDTIRDQKRCAKSPTQRTPRGPMFVTIKTIDGAILQVFVKPNDTIQMVKSRVQDLIGMPPEQQRLIFCGKQLEDGRTLSDYDIQREFTMHRIG